MIVYNVWARNVVAVIWLCRLLSISSVTGLAMRRPANRLYLAVVDCCQFFSQLGMSVAGMGGAIA